MARQEDCPRPSVAWLPLMAACALASVSFPAIPVDLTTPVQQRIAVNGRDSISVGWQTYTKLDTPCVRFGTAPDCLDRRACGDGPVTYPTSRTYANAVTLPGLRPAQTYYYQIESTNASVAVEPFLSPRLPGDRTPFTMNAVVDLGVYGEDGFTVSMDPSKRDAIPSIPPALNHTTIGRLAATADDYELVVHPGDFAYADDWFLSAKNLLDGRDAYQAILEQFFDQLAPVAARKPYLASPGNHEANCEEIPYTSGLCPAGQRNFTDFLHRFGRTMPSAYPSASANHSARAAADTARRLAQPPFWYSFEYGMAHVVMIDTETDFAHAPDGPGGSAGLNGGPFGDQAAQQQLAFLEADLRSVDRDVTPWLIVAGHRPWYSTGGADNVCQPCQAAFEPLFFRYGVDLGIFGHVHNAQRFLPVNNSVADPAGLHNPCAPAYIVAGGAGNIEGLSAVGSNATANVFAYADDFSYAAITFQDAHHLQIDFFQSSNGVLLDRSVLYKEHNERFVVQS